jgi:hypothetical protein
VVSTGAQRRIVWVSAPGDYATFNSNHTPDGTGDVGTNPLLEAFGQCSDVFDLVDRAEFWLVGPSRVE